MKMTDATEISSEVRATVYKRDSWDECPCCVYCGKPYPQVHHYIERSRGGLGIEENLVCLCADCHYRLHNSEYTKMTKFVKEYLMGKYPDWDEKKLIKEKEYDICEKGCSDI